MNNPEHMTTEHFSFWDIDEYGDQMVSCSCGWGTAHGLPTAEVAADSWGDHMYDVGCREAASTIESHKEELFQLARLATAGWVGEATGRDRDVQLYVGRLAHRHRHDVLGGRLKALITWPMAVLRWPDRKAES